VNEFLLPAALSAVVSGLFSVLGISLRSFRHMELERLLDRRPDGEARLQWLMQNLSALRLAASLCRSLANLLLVLFLLMVFDAPQAGLWTTVTAMAIAGGLVGMFGVAIPHAWASYAGEKLIIACLPALKALRWILAPLVWMMSIFDVPIRRLSGVLEQREGNGDAAKREILYAAEEGRAEGAVDESEADMIESVIELSDTDAGEIMTPRTDIFALPVETAWEDACQAVSAAGHSRVPVYENDIDNIIGILYAKDLLELVHREEQSQLRSIIRKCYFVPETKPVNELLKEFQARKVHIAVILDEYGGTAGLVTIEDILEEIVGEISDEYDEPEPVPLARLDEHTVEVEGRLSIDDLNDALEIEIPEDEDYETVAGFLFSELGYIPAVGETLQTESARYTVLAADERKITRIRVERISEDAPTGE
jgi:CBS domain containing-hemolysin-like protein